MCNYYTVCVCIRLFKYTRVYIEIQFFIIIVLFVIILSKMCTSRLQSPSCLQKHTLALLLHKFFVFSNEPNTFDLKLNQIINFLTIEKVSSQGAS